MKLPGILIIPILFLSSILTYSQPYHPLLAQNKYWDVVYWGDGLNGGGIIPEYRGERQFIDGDTIMNNKVYQILKAHPLGIVDPGPFYPPFYVKDIEYIIGFMREDTINKKVYTYMSREDKEYLTYDFSLQPGDSLDIGYLTDQKIVLDTICTENLLNGTSRKKFGFKGFIMPVNNDFYIESIGGPSSLLYPFDYNFEWGSGLDGVGESGSKIF